MNTINVVAIDANATSAGLFLTTAGYCAIKTPCAMKEFISNNKRNQKGRSYLTGSFQRDDTQIAVQFICTDSIDAGLPELMDRFTNNKAKFFGEYFLFKSITNICKQGSYYLFTANLVKLA